MNQNWSEQLMSVINQIAEKLGVATEYVYPMLRKQAMVEGLVNVFWIGIISVLCFILIKGIIKVLKLFEEDMKDENIPPIIIYSIVSAIIIGIGLIFIPSLKETLTAFLNPDWYIINNILGKLIE